MIARLAGGCEKCGPADTFHARIRHLRRTYRQRGN